MRQHSRRYCAAVAAALTLTWTGQLEAAQALAQSDLLVGELGNWRVQRVTLQPM